MFVLRIIPKINNLCFKLDTLKKHRLEANGLMETVDREAIFEAKFIFAPFSKFDIAS